MNFRVGQRVRVIASLTWPEAVGREATIIENDRPGHWMVMVDGLRCPYTLDGAFGASAYAIEPLTDPGEKSITIADILALPNAPDFSPRPRVAA